MTDERLNGHHNYESDLKGLYRKILSEMAAEYTMYREYAPEFLSSLETNSEHSVSYSILIFFELYEQLMATREFRFFDVSIMDNDADDDIFEKMKPILKASYSKNNQQRLSEDNFDISTLSDIDKREMAAYIIRHLQAYSKQLNWSKDIVDVTMMLLIFLRQILGSINNAELFYHAAGMFIDRLTSSEYYQAGRDIAEEVILSSYKDGISEVGYFNSFRLYSNIGSIHASLMYANLSLTCILKKATSVFRKVG